MNQLQQYLLAADFLKQMLLTNGLKWHLLNGIRDFTLH